MEKVPKKIQNIIKTIEKAGFEAYLVGGCMRDLLRDQKPKDWDVATNAKPEKIESLFEKTFLDNKFGTVKVRVESKDESLKEVEITPYRIDEKYSDKRHPDKIKWTDDIKEDLARRDFTINAIAGRLNKSKLEIIDPYSGQKDIEKKIVKAVGDPKERFSEDSLRMMRAVRFASVLGFKIEKETEKAIKENAPWLQAISKERIRDELMKIIMCPRAAEGVDVLRETGLLKYIIPELLEGYEVDQNKHHIYDCYEHSILSLKYAAKKGFNKYVRLAALLHDVGKPRSKEGEGEDATFYSHEIIGAKMTAQIMARLKFSKKDIEKVVKLVRYHLFYYNVGEVSESSVRRLVRKVGLGNVEELLQVRMADRIGSGVPKAEPYKLRHLKYVVEKVSRDPISAKMLKIGGKEIMDILNEKPGPKVGWVLDILLGEVLTDPSKNNKKNLLKRVKELSKLKDKELQKKAFEAKKEREEIETKKDKMTKKKYWVT